MKYVEKNIKVVFMTTISSCCRLLIISKVPNYAIPRKCLIIIWFRFFFFLFSLAQFKALVAEKFEAEPEQLCLIFAGKIMKDNDTMKSHNIKDGLTVHLVSFWYEISPDRTLTLCAMLHFRSLKLLQSLSLKGLFVDQLMFVKHLLD